MQSLYYLLGLVGVALVLIWSIQNDKLGSRGGRLGLFAIRDEDDDDGGASHPRRGFGRTNKSETAKDSPESPKPTKPGGRPRTYRPPTHRG